MTRAILPGMIAAGGGAVVNVSSIAGLVAGGGGAAYTASKHGVIGLTRQIAYDYGKKGVRANAICPGAVETAMTKDILTSGDMAVMDLVRSVPAGCHGQPEEVAKLALYLASDDSSFVHGAVMAIDGGWTVR
jgi:3-oxoacyl-[acyl-carrier protein] reductase